MKYQIIQTGSKGNCFRYKNVLIDVGVSFEKLSAVLKDIKIILITHKHSDHINVSTLKNIYKYHPNILIFGIEDCYEFLKQHDVVIQPIKLNQEITIELGDLSSINIRPVFLYHDVDNYGYLIDFEGFMIQKETIFYGTDTHSLENIKIPKCDKIFLECNYEDNKIQKFRKEAESTGKFDYTRRVELTHLSLRQWLDFCLEFLKKDGVAYAMHQSTNNSPLDKIDFIYEELELLNNIY